MARANTFQGSEGVRFAYAEFNLPLIGPDQQISGAQRLDVTAAVRGGDYNTFGDVTTPKLGVLYGPNPDFTLKASWGKSFKAPTLSSNGTLCADRVSVLSGQLWRYRVSRQCHRAGR